MTLLVATVCLRPYVFAFVALFALASVRDLGPWRTVLFAASVWPLTWLAEFSSTRIGVPFGLYHYTGLTRGSELYLADMPIMDSLSFTFLAYAAFCVARVALRRSGTGSCPALAATTGLLMMLLDAVMDPLAVRGDQWFLGRIFYYAREGVYFGVPWSNFAGWVIVGAAGVGLYLGLVGGDTRAGAGPAGGVAVYYAVLSFNLVVTASIGEWRLLGVGLALHAALAVVILRAALRPSARPAWRSEGHERSAVPDVVGRGVRPEAEAGR